MTTTITTKSGQQVKVELVKQGSEPLWTVALVRGRGLAKESVQVGRITRAASDLWMSEHGFGWDDHSTRKAALTHLVASATA